MKLTIPELAVVALVGPSGSGKSSFARNHFRPTEVLSSDFCRGLVSDDENSQAATNDAFEVLHFIAAKRLTAGKLVVIDATNVQAEARKPIIALARQYHCLPVAIVFDLPEKLCHERNRDRPDRNFGPFDIIGDIHGCFEELVELLTQLGYSIERQTNGDGSPGISVKPPEGRKLVFLGDLVDRGPKIPEVLRL